MANEAGKQAAARAAAARIESGMIVGLGTGTTARFFVEALGDRLRGSDGDGGGSLRNVRGVPTSAASEALARQAGIPLVPLDADTRPDVTVDGADEIGPNFALIKGGGGALVREKLVAAASGTMLVIADSSKMVADGAFGAFPLPVAVFPFGWDVTQARLADTLPGVVSVLRRHASDGSPFVTDDGLFLLDFRFGTIPDPPALEAQLRSVVGVAEVGLFVGIATVALIGADDGTVQEFATG